jgi:hypothetical protein
VSGLSQRVFKGGKIIETETKKKLKLLILSASGHSNGFEQNARDAMKSNQIKSIHSYRKTTESQLKNSSAKRSY